MILIVSSKCAVRELAEWDLTQDDVREIHSGDSAAFRFLDGHFWTLVFSPKHKRMMWFPINGVGEPQRVVK
jgi:hypothetical protein